jgi:DNA polymerase III epsilon subunit-like protein
MKLILSTENTGTESQDQVIELAIIDADTTQTLFNQRFKPSVFIKEQAASVHGITLGALAHIKTWADYHDHILEIIKNAESIMTYNCDFDFRLMRQTAEAFDRVWPQVIPPCRDLRAAYADIAQIEFNEYYGTWKWQKLEVACQQQGIDVSDLKTHNALDDCRAIQRLYKKLKGAFDAYWKPFVKPQSTRYEEFKENIEEISQLFSQGLSISHIHQKLSQDGKISLSYTHFTKFFKDYTETYVSLAESPAPRLAPKRGPKIARDREIEFQANKHEIIVLLNKGYSKAQIHRLLKKQGKWNTSYANFTEICRQYNVRKHHKLDINKALK